MENRCAFLLLAGLAVAGCQSDPVDDCPSHDNCSGADAAVGSADDLLMPVGCIPACSGDHPYCTGAGQCVVCVTDDNCPTGQVCGVFGGRAACVPGCADDAKCRMGGGSASCCGKQCVDTMTDLQNCGGCGQACAPENGVGMCVAGQCTLSSCTPGFGDCDKSPANGCEANLHVDPLNCVACGTVCAAANGIPGCGDGCYLKACDFGWDDCNGDPTDGCEKSVLSDAMNCGGCKRSCLGAPHAQGSCKTAACMLVCDQGFSDCDGNAQTGCERPTSADANNCGGCGLVCPQGLVCVNSSCTCPNCQLPHAKTACVNNQCVLDSCFNGFGDCDKNQQNGCEADFAGDSKNCGGCGMACPQGQVCTGGGCATFGDYLVGSPCNNVNYGNGCMPSDTGYHYRGEFNNYKCWWHTKNQAWNTTTDTNIWHLATHFGLNPATCRVQWCDHFANTPMPLNYQVAYNDMNNIGAWGWCAEQDPLNGGWACCM